MVEYGHKIEEEVNAIQSEVKQIYGKSTVKGRKLRLKSMIWSRWKK